MRAPTCTPTLVYMVAWAAAVTGGFASGPAWSGPFCDRMSWRCSSEADDGHAELELDNGFGGWDDDQSDNVDRPLVLLPVVWSVIAKPLIPVKGTDQRIHLAYELLFTNVTPTIARIEAVDAVDPSQDDEPLGVNRVVTILDEDVTGEVRLFSLETTFDKANYSFLLPPGQSGIVYVDLTFSDWEDVPHAIGHRVTVSQPDVQGTPEFTSVGGLAKVDETGAVVVRPPLRGDRWVDGDGCCTIIGPHRFTVLPINGTERAPEHFAIDFVQLDEEGRAFTGDPKVLDNWLFYGADVLAAAPGEVVEVVNDLPDQVPGKLPPGITAAEASGNHVIIDMGDGQFALYAHMIPGSVMVEEGQFVRSGQRLGRLGNSGNTDAPHLHFQIMDRPSALEATGLPFVFDRMALQGRLMGPLAEVNALLLAGGSLPIDTTETGFRRREMPLTNDVLGFR